MQKIGKILKSNGTDGGMLVSSVIDPQEFAEDNEPVYVIFDGLEVPFFVQDSKPRGCRWIVHLNDVLNLRDAEEMVGREILAEVEEEEDDTQDFTGWKVFDCSSAATFGHSAAPLEIGVVTGDEPIPGNYCIYVSLNDAVLRPGSAKTGSREVLIPLHADFVVSADEQAKELMLNIPEGLY